MKTLCLFVLAGLFSAWLSGCMTQKRVTKYLDNHRFFGSGYCMDNYPCLGQVLPGQIIHTSDTLFLPGDSIPCQLPDTGKMIGCPPHMIIHDSLLIHDTIPIFDSARFAHLTAQISALQSDSVNTHKDLTKSKDEADKLKNQSKNRLIWIIALAGILFSGIAGWTLAKFKII